MNEQLHEQIEAYLKGSLPPPEREAFEQQLGQDPELSALVAQHRLERQALELLVEADLFDRMRHWDAAAVAPPLRAVPGRRWPRMLAWAAAMAGMVLGAWWLALRYHPDPAPLAQHLPLPKPAPQNPPGPALNRKPGTEKNTGRPRELPSPARQEAPVAQAVEPKSPETPTKLPSVTPPEKDYAALAADFYRQQDFFNNQAGNTSGDALYNRAYGDFKAGKFSNVTQALRSTLSGNNQNKELMAHSFYQSAHYDAAYDVFNELRSARDGAMAERADWGLALTLLHQLPAKRPLLDRVLDKIITKPGHTYASEAKALKAKLNE